MTGHFIKTLFALLCLAFLALGSIWFMEFCYKSETGCPTEVNRETMTEMSNSILDKVS